MSRRVLRSLRRRALEAARPAPIAYEKARARLVAHFAARVADVTGELTDEQAATLADVDGHRAARDVYRRWLLADGEPDPRSPAIAARRRAEVRDRILELRAERRRTDPAPPPEESTPNATSEEDAHGPP